LQGEVDEPGGNARDGEREQEDVARELDHGRPQRRLVEDQLDEVRPGHARADDADRVRRGGQQHRECVSDERVPLRVPQIHRAVDAWRHGIKGEEPPRAAAAYGDGACADPGKQARLEIGAQTLAGRRVEHHGRNLCRGKPVAEPVAAEVRHRRHVDQDLGDEDEEDGQREQTRG
jgi:hypothetical protein